MRNESVEQQITSIMRELKNKAPTAEQISILLVESVGRYIQGGARMKVEKSDEKYLEFSGDKKDLTNTSVNSVIGRYGETVVYEGIKQFVTNNDTMSERYGNLSLDETLKHLIPADANKAYDNRRYLRKKIGSSEQQQRQIAYDRWEKLVGRTKKGKLSVTDFFVGEAMQIVEVKAKLNSYLTAHGKEIGKPTDPLKVNFRNPYKSKVDQLTLGAVWVDTEWKRVAETIFKSDTKKRLDRLIARKTSEIKESSPDVYDIRYQVKESGSNTAESVVSFYKLVSVKVESFAAFTADKKKLANLVKNKFVYQADMEALRIQTTWNAEKINNVVVNHLMNI